MHIIGSFNTGNRGGRASQCTKFGSCPGGSTDEVPQRVRDVILGGFRWINIKSFHWATLRRDYKACDLARLRVPSDMRNIAVQADGVSTRAIARQHDCMVCTVI